MKLMDQAIVAWQEHSQIGEFEASEAEEIAQIKQQKLDYILPVAREKAARFHNDANARMGYSIRKGRSHQ